MIFAVNLSLKIIMFTGIITDIGQIEEISNKKGDLIIEVSTDYEINTIDIGASISHNGVCLTVIEKKEKSYLVQISNETIEKSNFNNLQIGDKFNLERALKIGDELGGHMVLGHVDSIATVKSIENIQESYKIDFEVDDVWKKFISQKGSVTLNGTSLTVNEVVGNVFSVNIIPHTWSETTFKYAKIGDEVNLEVDTIARYVDRLLNN